MYPSHFIHESRVVLELFDIQIMPIVKAFYFGICWNIQPFQYVFAYSLVSVPFFCLLHFGNDIFDDKERIDILIFIANRIVWVWDIVIVIAFIIIGVYIWLSDSDTRQLIAHLHILTLHKVVEWHNDSIVCGFWILNTNLVSYLDENRLIEIIHLSRGEVLSHHSKSGELHCEGWTKRRLRKLVCEVWTKRSLNEVASLRGLRGLRVWLYLLFNRYQINF